MFDDPDAEAKEAPGRFLKIAGSSLGAGEKEVFVCLFVCLFVCQEGDHEGDHAFECTFAQYQRSSLMRARISKPVRPSRFGSCLYPVTPVFTISVLAN